MYRATCGRRHHIAVCTGKRSEEQPPTAPEDIVIIPHSVKMKPDGKNTVLLQTAKAWVEGPGGRTIARCLLDGGSQRSFIHENLEEPEVTSNQTRDTHPSHVWLLCSYNVMTQHSEGHLGECLGHPAENRNRGYGNLTGVLSGDEGSW